VLAATGEDAIAYCDETGYAANVEVVGLEPLSAQLQPPTAEMQRVHTPGAGSIAELSKALDVAADECLKLLIVQGAEVPAVGLLLRGDHELNAVKAARLSAVAQPLKMLGAEEVRAATGGVTGFVGPVGLDIPLFVDHAAAVLSDFVCGANEADYHLAGVNWHRDVALPQAADLRTAVAGDPAPGGGTLSIARGIEVGQIFQLGTKYSKAMGATVLDADGKTLPMVMGCYGIGVTRVIAAAIEQNHDERGIIWPAAIAPFDVVVIPINMDKSPAVAESTGAIHSALSAAGFDVLVDDRPQRPGFRFADADLIGFPHRLVVSDKTLEQGKVEYRHRSSQETQLIPLEGLPQWLGTAG